MFFKDVIGQDTAKQQLIQEVREGRIPHAQLFCGPAGVGKLPLAMAYARYICCPNRTETDACGTCPSCVKWNKLVHPDVHFVFPIVKSAKGKKEVCDDYIADWRHLVLSNPYFSLNHWLNEMGAENGQAIIYAKESDEITRKLSLKSSEGGYKVTIVWLPEKLHEVCANKLLKLLEEPPEKTIFLLVSEAPEMILSTILSPMVAPVIIYVFIPVAFAETSSSTLGFIQRVCLIYILITFLSFINSFLKAVYAVYSEKEQLRDRPLKGMLQTVQVILWFVGAIVVVSILIDKSPLSLLAGLGASAAILMLVFKDSIMGFVSGVQLSANDMLKVGDWITMPKYGADGTVIEVTLNTVKVRNFDNTITTIPPYLLISDSFQNWQGMQESGGRRVKRSINIDMTSVHFCTPEMLAKYRKIQLLKDYVDETEKVVEEYNKEHHIDNSVLVNGRRQTNLGVFRA